MAAALKRPKLSRNARAILRPRREPGRWPAAALALAFHVVFFALLVWSVRWQVKVEAPLTAEVWDSLPPIQQPIMLCAFSRQEASCPLRGTRLWAQRML